MHSGSHLSNGMRPPSAMLPPPFGPRQAASIRPPQCRPCLTFSITKAIPLAVSSPQGIHSRTEFLPARKTHSFHHYHVGGGSAPNSSDPFQHSRDPATPLRPEIRLSSPPAPSLDASRIRDPQTPSAYPIWRQVIIELLRSLHCLPIQSSIGQAARPLGTSTKPFPSTKRHPRYTAPPPCEAVPDTSSPKNSMLSVKALRTH